MNEIDERIIAAIVFGRAVALLCRAAAARVGNSRSTTPSAGAPSSVSIPP